MQNSNLNRLEPIRNGKNCLPFSFCTLSLSAQFLIEIQFFRNSGHFRWSKSFISSREEAKNSQFRQKSLQNYLQRKILRRKGKKLVFITYFFHVYCIYLSISIQGLLCPYMFCKIAMTMNLFNLGRNQVIQIHKQPFCKTHHGITFSLMNTSVSSNRTLQIH